jgi:hypothetical protein
MSTAEISPTAELIPPAEAQGVSPETAVDTNALVKTNATAKRIKWIGGSVAVLALAVVGGGSMMQSSGKSPVHVAGAADDATAADGASVTGSTQEKAEPPVSALDVANKPLPPEEIAKRVEQAEKRCQYLQTVFKGDHAFTAETFEHSIAQLETLLENTGYTLEDMGITADVLRQYRLNVAQKAAEQAVYWKNLRLDGLGYGELKGMQMLLKKEGMEIDAIQLSDANMATLLTMLEEGEESSDTKTVSE